MIIMGIDPGDTLIGFGVIKGGSPRSCRAWMHQRPDGRKNDIAKAV